MPLTPARITALQKRAAVQPGVEAGLSWTFVWGLVTCGLFWLFQNQAFPIINNAQGVSLPWVGGIITTGGLIALGLCYMLYKTRLRMKRAAKAQLLALIAEHHSRDD